jgi:hypothetical protein
MSPGDIVVTMAVKIRLKGDHAREVVFPDSETNFFTAQDYPDGHVEVTQSPRGSTGPGVVVYQFTQDEIDTVIDNGWASDNGSLN